MFYEINIRAHHGSCIAYNVFWVTNGIEDNLLVNQNAKDAGFPRGLCTPKYLVEEIYDCQTFVNGDTFACNADTLNALLAMTEEYVKKNGCTWTVKEYK